MWVFSGFRHIRRNRRGNQPQVSGSLALLTAHRGFLPERPHIILPCFALASHHFVRHRIALHCIMHIASHRIAINRSCIALLASHIASSMPQTRTKMLYLGLFSCLSGGLRPPHPPLSEECNSFYFRAAFCYDVRYGAALAFSCFDRGMRRGR